LNNFCQNCGTSIDVDGNACIECGFQFNNSVRSETKSSNNSSKLVLGYLMSIISLFFIPLLFGSISIYIGLKVKKSGHDSEGLLLVIVASILMTIGIILGMVVGAITFSNLF